MTIYWRHVQKTDAGNSGFVFDFIPTTNDPGTHVKSIGGYCHPMGSWLHPATGDPVYTWPSGDEETGLNPYYPIIGTRKYQASPGGVLTTYMSIAFGVPPRQACNVHIWWDLET